MGVLAFNSNLPQFSPHSILRALWKRKLLILSLWLLGSAGTVLVVNQLRPVYEASSLILVESQKIPENFVAATVQTDLDGRLEGLKQKVLSRDRLWRLMLEYSLYPEARQTQPAEEVVELMRKDITIALEKSWTSRPGAFRVSYQAYSAATAAAMANRIGQFFIDENLREREVQATGTSEFLDSQMAESKAKLQEQEARLSAFKTTYSGELPQQEGALLASLSQGRTELMGIQDALARIEQNRVMLESSLMVARDNLRQRQELARARARQSAAVAGTPAEPAAQPGTPPSPLETAQARLRELQSRYYDQHPEVQRMQAEVRRLEEEDAARRRLEAEERRLHPAIVASGQRQAGADTPGDDTPEAQLDHGTVDTLKAQLQGVNQEAKDLERRRLRVLDDIASVQGHLQKIPIREQQLKVITRDYDTSRSSYDSLLSKKLSADVATNMERWQKAQRFVMLERAQPPEKPVRPKRIALSAAGILASLGMAGAFSFLLELRRNVLLGEWELPAGTIVMGRVPAMKIESL